MTSDRVIQRMLVDLGTSAQKQSEAKSRRQKHEIKVLPRLPRTKLQQPQSLKVDHTQ